MSTPPPEPRWWLLVQDQPTGPHSLKFIRNLLQNGTLSTETLACLVGTEQWRPLGHFAQFQAEPGARPVPPPRPPFAPMPGSTPSLPWNPMTIAWLGLIFSPVWAGIMTALNSQRLGLQTPLRRPLLIGVGSLLLSLFISWFLFESYWFDLLLYLGALGGLWYWDLAEQQPVFDQQFAQRAQASWVVPCWAGSPVACLVFLALIVAPLLPPQPRDVCEAFMSAPNAATMRQYTTSSLYPLLEDLERIEQLVPIVVPSSGTNDSSFELTEDEPAPPEIGGHLVGCRIYFPRGQDLPEPVTINSILLLKDYSGTWKVDGWVITDINGEERNPPIPFADFWHDLADDMQREADQIRAQQKPPEVVTRPLWHRAGLYFATMNLLKSGAFKKLGVLLIALIGGLAAWSRMWTRTPSPTAAAETDRKDD